MRRAHETDAAEQVRHVRRLHGSLLLLALGLIATTHLATPGAADRALEQLEGIHAVLDRWQPDWLARYAERVAPPPAPGFEPRFAVPLAGRPEPVTVELEAGAAALTLSPLPPRLRPLVRAGARIDEPESLEAFASLWNALESKLGVHRPAEPIGDVLVLDVLSIFGKTGDGASAVPLEPARREGAGAAERPVTLRFGTLGDFHDHRVWRFVRDITQRPMREVFGLDDEQHLFFGHSDTKLLALPVSTETGSFRGQVAFDTAYGVDWKPGPFERSFPELAQVAELLRDLPPERQRALLRIGHEDRVALLGRSVRSMQLLVWGATAMLLLQLFFWLHAAQLRADLAAGEPHPAAPWVGLHPGVAARLTTLASASLLPPAALAVQLAQHDWGIEPSGRWALPVALLAGTLLLAVLGLRALLGLWRDGRGLAPAQRERATQAPRATWQAAPAATPSIKRQLIAPRAPRRPQPQEPAASHRPG